MKNRAIRNDAQNEDDFRTELRSDKYEFRKENKYLLKENKALMSVNADLRVQNERLSVRAEFSVIGDALLTLGSIGFGFLGTYDGVLLSDSFHSGLSWLCFGGAVIGFGLKIFQWWKTAR